MRKVKVGIVGCGGIANGKHMPALKHLDNVEMVAFCDLIPERAQQAAAEYGAAGARVTTDYRELLAMPEVEVVHVLTPNKWHAPITVAALDAGKHVMCEKPMAIDYAGAKSMMEAAERNQKLLTIGYQSRHKPESIYLKRMIEDGDLGEIYFAKAKCIRRRGVPTWGVFLDAEQQGGGPLIDIATHALDLTLWLMDNYKPKMVVGNAFRKLAEHEGSANPWGPWDPKEFTVEDSGFGYITFENGAVVMLECSWALNTLESEADGMTVLCGTKAGADMKGGLRINGEKNGRLYVTEPDFSAGGVDFYEGAALPPHFREIEVWIRAVAEGTPLVTLPEQAATVTRILGAIYESSQTGKPVFFD